MVSEMMTASQAREWNGHFGQARREAQERYLRHSLLALQEVHAQLRLTLASNPDSPHALGALVGITDLIARRQDDTSKPLGSNQMALLRFMANTARKDGMNSRFYPGCGWIWENRSTTIRLLEALERRGYVARTPRGDHGIEFHITDDGRTAAAAK
jgi:hypothetical protein